MAKLTDQKKMEGELLRCAKKLMKYLVTGLHFEGEGGGGGQAFAPPR